VFRIGDKVKAKALNDEAFIGTVIALDQQGFAYVNFENISEARILITELESYESPKVVGCMVCGFRTDEVEAVKEFQLNGCKCSK
jgi:ribosomal protein S1